MISKLLPALAILVSFSAHASPGQWRVIGTQDIWIPAPATPVDVDRELKRDLVGVLRNYYPSGSNISNRRVEGHQYWARISFTVTKKIGPFEKSADFVGAASTPSRSKACPADAVGAYYLEFDLAGSSSLVLDNATKFGLDLCVEPKDDGSHSFFIKSRIWMREGADFGGQSGKTAVGLLKAQAWPLLVAIQNSL
ncbi:MAG: hypothetical protein HY075_06895 [Deltaproteobacteria bacterium]|nr:hypothetical protein [Deltaproteobacteria bacterium]